MALTRSIRRVIGLAFLLMTLVASEVSAQARASVKQDGTTIWRPGFLNVATVVPAGTQLDVVGRSGEWIEVLLPARGGGPRIRGFVAESAVELTGPIPESGSSAAPLTGTRAPGVRVASRAAGFSASRLRAFATVGYGRFLARRSFNAMFGAPGGASYGLGAEAQSARGAFVAGSIDYFQLTGQRVFVDNGEVFRLGITDVVTILPVNVTAGYRASRGRVAPYAGAGIGRYFLRDDYAFADADARKYQSFTSYHALVGVEWWAARHVGTAFEVQYSHVPKALDGGIGADLDEDNLGGAIARLKVMFGR